MFYRALKSMKCYYSCMILFPAWYVVLASLCLVLLVTEKHWWTFSDTTINDFRHVLDMLRLLLFLSSSLWWTFIRLLTYLLYISHDINLHSAELTLGVTGRRQRFSVHTEFSWNYSVSSWDRQKPLLYFSEKKNQFNNPWLTTAFLQERIRGS